MTSIRTLIVMSCVTALAPVAFAQNAANAPSAPSASSAPSAPPPRIAAAEAKNHIGETATVCGKVVDSRKLGKYGLGGYGKPVSFDLDQPEANSVFYFVTFGVLPPRRQHSAAAAQPGDAQPNSAAAPAAGTPPAAGAPSAAGAPPTTAAAPPATDAPGASAPPAAGAPPAADAAPSGPPPLTGPQEAIAAYTDKSVCVTGKITNTASSQPFILQPDRSQIKIQEGSK